MMRNCRLIPFHPLFPCVLQGVLRYILDRDAHVPFLGLNLNRASIFRSIICTVISLVTEVVHYFLSLKYGIK